MSELDKLPRLPAALHRASVCLCLVMCTGCPASSGVPAGLEACADPRPEICTQHYDPVCATREDGSRATYSNGCMACADLHVTGYVAGACPED